MLDQNAPVIAGELTPLKHNLYRLCANNPSAMTGPGTNTYIYGLNELAVFDAGPDMQSHIENILDAQDTLNAPITRIFSSHTHSDHSPAVAKLKEELPDASVIGLPPPVDQLYEDLTFVADYQPQHNQSFEHDGQSIVAIHTPGHVANHLCFLITEHAFLTTGDHLMNGSTVVIIPPKGNMRDYIRSLKLLQDYQIHAMGPGHGEVIPNPNEVVAWTIEHRLQREAKIVAAMSKDNAQSIPQLVSIVYEDTPKHLHPIAEMSLHAHLIKLKEEQTVKESNGEWQLIAG